MFLANTDPTINIVPIAYLLKNLKVVLFGCVLGWSWIHLCLGEMATPPIEVIDLLPIITASGQETAAPKMNQHQYSDLYCFLSCIWFFHGTLFGPDMYFLVLMLIQGSLRMSSWSLLVRERNDVKLNTLINKLTYHCIYSNSVSRSGSSGTDASNISSASLILCVLILS